METVAGDVQGFAHVLTVRGDVFGPTTLEKHMESTESNQKEVGLVDFHVVLLGLQLTAKNLETGWTVWAWARDSDGNNVPACSPSACCWCIQGAMEKARSEILCVQQVCFDLLDQMCELVADEVAKDHEAWRIVSLAAQSEEREEIPRGIPYFNDAFGVKKEMVLRVVNAAIKNLTALLELESTMTTLS